MIKIDLHTHSHASADGSITADNYKYMLSNKKLEYIAITDHNSIDLAIELNEKFGDRIIVGEEIKTTEGEIIGLYLSQLVPTGLSLDETIDQIKSQGGLVYVPHPLEKLRSGISKKNLIRIADRVDIIESYNGRALNPLNRLRLTKLAKRLNIAVCGSSDAHGRAGWGRTYTLVPTDPNKNNLVELLSESKIVYKHPSIRALLYPKYNKLKSKS